MWILPKSLQLNGFTATEGTVSDFTELSKICASSLLVRSKAMPSRIWLRKLKAGGWTRFLVGRIARRSLAKSFEDALISSLPPIPAKASLRPVGAREKEILDSYGLGSSGQLSLFDLGESSSKTLKGTYRLDSPQSSAIWKKLVTGWRQDYLARRNAARLIAASESSYSRSAETWPTPRSGENGSDSGSKRRLEQGANPGLKDMARQWPTPILPNKRGTTSHYSGDQKAGRDLKTEAQNWPTPDAQLMNDGEEPDHFEARQAKLKASGINGNGAGTPLAMKVKQWTTPQAHDVTQRGSGQQPCSKAGNACLARDAAQWGTPTSRDWKDGSCEDANVPTNGLLGRESARFYPHGHQDPETSRNGGESSKSTRRLNPRFVEWLMGLPTGWTDCDYAEMASSRTPPLKPSTLCTGA